MGLFGWFLAVGGVCGLVFGIRMMLKLKKMMTVPFRVPSQIAQQKQAAADAKNMISTEGQVVSGAELLTAPMSGERCLAFEIKIDRRWEREKVTDKGTETERGTTNLSSEYRGSIFDLRDDHGVVHVDVTRKPDAKMVQTHSSTINVGTLKDAIRGVYIPAVLEFGRLNYTTPQLPRDTRTVGFVGTETVLKPSGTFYALGQLKETTIIEPVGKLAGKLVLSREGRTALVASLRRNQLLGFILGGTFALGGTTLALLSPKHTTADLPTTSDTSTLAKAAVEQDGERPFALNQKVKVSWKGGWYNASILQIKDGRYEVHYDGYADSWNEWVEPSRLRRR